MNKETLENNLKNMISLDLFNSSKWNKLNDLELKEYNTYNSRLISLSSLNINNINDLAEKVTAPIYYLFSCLQDYFRNSENVEIPLKDISVSPDFVPDDHIDFFAKTYFFNEVEEGKLHPLDFSLNLNLVIYFMKKKQFIRLKQVLMKNLKKVLVILILIKILLKYILVI